LLLAAACLSRGQTVFTGDEQIRRRSAANLIAALADLGARAESTRGNGCAPFVCQGPLRGGQTAIECPTSQYLSALLLATPLAEEDTTIEVPLLNEKPYVDITLSWLDAQQIRYEREGYGRFKIQGGQSYRAFDRALSGDYSSAGFLFCAAAVGKAPVTVSGLDPRDPQGDKGMLGILERMGCRIEWRGAEVTVYPPASADGLRGGTFDLNAMPDALPALAVTAAFARAEVRLTNVPQAREKETDRIAVMASLLSELGVDCEELPDGLVIRGRGRLGGGRVHGHGDHRVVMSLAVGALGAVEPLTIEGAEAAGVTFPGFFDALEQLRSA
jgi:3-phosphoshikimate 1-carboxyvinyltransferase